jgi:hypothetical protein
MTISEPHAVIEALNITAETAAFLSVKGNDYIPAMPSCVRGTNLQDIIRDLQTADANNSSPCFLQRACEREQDDISHVAAVFRYAHVAHCNDHCRNIPSRVLRTPIINARVLFICVQPRVQHRKHKLAHAC